MVRKNPYRKPDYYMLSIIDSIGGRYYLCYAEVMKYYYLTKWPNTAEKFKTKDEAIKAYSGYAARFQAPSTKWISVAIEGLYYEGITKGALP